MLPTPSNETFNMYGLFKLTLIPIHIPHPWVIDATRAIYEEVIDPRSSSYNRRLWNFPAFSSDDRAVEIFGEEIDYYLILSNFQY